MLMATYCNGVMFNAALDIERMADSLLDAGRDAGGGQSGASFG